MPQYRNISGERRSVAVLGGRWVDPDEVITVPDSLAEPYLVWPEVTWERTDPAPVSEPDSAIDAEPDESSEVEEA